MRSQERLRESPAEHESIPSNERLRQIADSGKDYFEIEKLLRADKDFPGEISRIQEKYAEYFEDTVSRELGIPTTGDWEMLTIIELYDKTTATHCVETYGIAREKISRPLFGTYSLKDAFGKENVELGQFLRACLLHDIGKVDVPHEVVNNHVADLECADILLHHPQELDAIMQKRFPGVEVPRAATAQELLHTIYTLRPGEQTRPQMIAPLRLLITDPHLSKEENEAELRRVNAQLEHYNLTVENTLLEVMAVHQRASEQILMEKGFEVEAALAGQHHYHGESSHNYFITVGSLQISINLADIIHFADVENALSGSRQYKQPQSHLAALHGLVLMAGNRPGPRAMAYLWVADEIDRMQKENTLPRDFDSDDSKHLDAIVQFLNTFRASLKDMNMDVEPFNLYRAQ